MSVTELEAAWSNIFVNQLMPLQSRNGGRPMAFLEFGYTDDVEAPVICIRVGDQPGTLFDPVGRQQQVNIFQAFFNVDDCRGNPVSGAFFWGNRVFTTDPDACKRIEFYLYCKPSADTIKAIYAQWLTASGEAPQALPLDDQIVAVNGTVQFTADVIGTPAPTFQWQVSKDAGATWTAIANAAPYSGATTAILTVTSAPKSLDGFRYRLVMTNSGGTVNSPVARLSVIGTAPLPTMSIDRTSLNFAAVTTGAAFTSQTPAQTVRLTQTGAGTVTWTAASTAPWLVVSPALGQRLGDADDLDAVRRRPHRVADRQHHADVHRRGQHAVADQRDADDRAEHRGAVAAVRQSSTRRQATRPCWPGSIALTGWTLDNIGVKRVELWRDLQPGETTPPFASTPARSAQRQGLHRQRDLRRRRAARRRRRCIRRRRSTTAPAGATCC